MGFERFNRHHRNCCPGILPGWLTYIAPLWPHSKKSQHQDKEVTGSACSMSGAMQVSIYTPHPVVRPDMGSDEVDRGHHMVGQEVLPFLSSPW